MSASEQQFRCHPSVVFTRLSENEAVLLHLDTKRYYSLNETGARLWELLQDGRVPDTLCEKILEEYDIDDNKARGFIREFLDELRREGLVESGGGH